jgi:hypothetical protein
MNITRDTLMSGTVTITVKPPENFLVSRALLGEEWHREYELRIERVDDPAGFPTLFLRTRTRTERDTKPKWVYTGIVHPRLGTVRLTSKSAFPAHSTRFRVSERVLKAIMEGRTDSITNSGWELSVEVEEELVGRF